METTLFDRYGLPKAYIDEEKQFIYLWNGKPIAYIEDEKVFGWKEGTHLGWFIDGILYDLKGTRVGFISDKCPVTPHSEPLKPTKFTAYPRAPHNLPFSRVSLSEVASKKHLEDFFSPDTVSFL
ncbi:MAG: hypothetical protein R3339_09990 [Thermodesulfobacteriota bacterium]|nr:hypothetical protein [Thermodesulfobacteriota bacterium]